MKNRVFKIAVFAVVFCALSALLVSCGSKDDGDTSGNAENGIISGDGSNGGAVSEFVSDVISTGEDIVSGVDDAVSEMFSDILPDGSDSSNGTFSDGTDDISFVSEGSVGNI